jgi:hypothetical protein
MIERRGDFPEEAIYFGLGHAVSAHHLLDDGVVEDVEPGLPVLFEHYRSPFERGLRPGWRTNQYLSIIASVCPQCVEM